MIDFGVKCFPGSLNRLQFSEAFQTNIHHVLVASPPICTAAISANRSGTKTLTLTAKHLFSLKLTANAPENRPSQQGNDPIPTIHFQVVLLLVSGRVFTPLKPCDSWSNTSPVRGRTHLSGIRPDGKSRAMMQLGVNWIGGYKSYHC